MIGAVILNYNDSERACNLACLLAGYSIIDKVIVVDNDSNDQE